MRLSFNRAPKPAAADGIDGLINGQELAEVGVALTISATARM